MAFYVADHLWRSQTVQVYFSNYEGYYFTGDGARREDGMYRIIGRVDDVINVSGHRFGTAEIENAINASSVVTESAVVGYLTKSKDRDLCLRHP